MDQVPIEMETRDKIRSGWAEAFAEMSANGDDRLLDDLDWTDWDEWEWLEEGRSISNDW